MGSTDGAEPARGSGAAAPAGTCGRDASPPLPKPMSSPRLERGTCCLGGSRSIHLSYEDDSNQPETHRRWLPAETNVTARGEDNEGNGNDTPPERWPTPCRKAKPDDPPPGAPLPVAPRPPAWGSWSEAVDGAGASRQWRISPLRSWRPGTRRPSRAGFPRKR